MADVFEIVQRRDLGALHQTLAANAAAAAARNADGASLFSFVYYAGWTEAAPVVRGALGALTAHEAIIAGDAAALQAALDAGWDANEHAPDGFTPLALAAFFGREDVFDVLLPLTRDLGARARNGQQVAALHAAAAARSRTMVEKLLRSGADPNLPQQAGFRALHTAAQHGDALMAGLLLLAGAEPAAAAENGKTAADFAREAEHGWLAARLERAAQRAV
jgi:ankyrin repeat protein